ncbi:MAG TPA: hypothetical protein VGI19_16990 [Candidatus Cybelea sp.]
MKLRRDPRDRRYPERLAGSFLASLIVHALLALLLFTVLVSSSQQGANENVQGGEVVTISRTSPVVVPNQPAVSHAALPIQHVQQVAPVRHAPPAVPQTQRLPTNRHELAKIAPSAPPNPQPIPQTTPQPAPQPTQNIFETKPANEVPAAPVNVPTVAPVAVSVKAPPTAAPSPSPSTVPVQHASPRPPAPTARPSVKPATPAPVLPSASPSPAAIARASPSPAPVSGVPSPSPTSTAAVAKTAGTAPKPAPSGAASSPGPHPGTGPKSEKAANRPIAVRPTPSPAARATAAAPKKQQTAPNINAKLRALLPNNPVHPTTGQYTPTYSLRGHLEPTPPPDVLARTQYMYEVKGTGNEARVKMWVVATRKAGPTTICTGWLVRYPQPMRGGYAEQATSGNVQNNVHAGPANGTQISIGGGGGHDEPLGPFEAGIAPIVDGMVSQPCDGRLLVKYAPSPAPSP